MEKHIDISEENVVVTLDGRMHGEDAELLGKELFRYIDQGYGNFIIDMAGLQYIDSTGMGVLIAINKQTQQTGGSIALSGLRGTVNELFEVTRLKKVFKIQE